MCELRATRGLITQSTSISNLKPREIITLAGNYLRTTFLCPSYFSIFENDKQNDPALIRKLTANHRLIELYSID
mgnify:CR=1 FL=1